MELDIAVATVSAIVASTVTEVTDGAVDTDSDGERRIALGTTAVMVIARIMPTTIGRITVMAMAIGRTTRTTIARTTATVTDIVRTMPDTTAGMVATAAMAVIRTPDTTAADMAAIPTPAVTTV